MITIVNLTKSFGGRNILENVSFRILPKDRIGLAGSNGSGKTTLLKLIAGREDYDAGNIILEDPGIKISLLSQLSILKPDHKVIDEMRSSAGEITQIEARLRLLEDEMSAFSGEPELLDDIVKKYGLLTEYYDHIRGKDIDWEIDRILQGLGFSLKDKNRYVNEFSGGWQMRLEFAKLLLLKSDVLMLDEPTNHLDVQAVEWLEEYLASYVGALVIVSHDRYFLNRLTSKTIYLSGAHAKMYSGNYDSFLKQKEIDEELLYKRYKQQQSSIEHDLRFIERFRYKATLASRVKSREKMLEKKKILAPPQKKEKTIHFAFALEESRMSRVFKFTNLEKSFPSLTVSFNGEIEIEAGERVSFVGKNGCGKTTLLNILSGKDKDYSGKLKVHPAATIKYYCQNQVMELVESNTVYQEIERTAPFDMTISEIRNRLAAFLFFGDDVFKKVAVLSGGERARLSIAKKLCSSANVLILDEPTNHLDIDSREALAVALNDFDGTVLLVSHDRYFIDQVCGRTVEIENGRLSSYKGNYSAYLAERKKQSQKAELLEKTEEHKKRILSNPIVKQDSSKALKRIIEQKELEIERAEERIKTIEALMADETISSDSNKIYKLSEEYGEISALLEKLFEEYDKLIS